ncbi:APC family permease [Candidatus Poribacteria bacterium]|nr:APC family permease [Candidatus Poribacteria bacterium]
MDGERGKLSNPLQDAQVSQGRLNQISEFIGEEVGDTSDWVEIYRTNDEWEVKLIQATLGAQQIRCRPVQVKRERRTALFVAPEHEVTALELVSQIDVAIAGNKVTTQSAEMAETLKQRDMAAVAEEDQQLTTDSGEILLAQREDIGSVVYVEGKGYELRVGPEPYTTVAENDWEEFTDFSAQRQEFVMLLRHEYPTLYEWIQQEKLLAEFIRLIEMTYQDDVPVPVPPRQYSKLSVSKEVDTTPYNSFALLSMTVAVISLITVLFSVPWQANLVLAAVVVLSGVIALFRIRMQAERDTEEEKTVGMPMALSAIVFACLVVVFSWWLDQRPEPESLENPPVREQVGDR